MNMQLRITMVAYAMAFTMCTASGYAASLAEENFESYNVGDPINGLNGGTGWNGAWNDIGGGTPTVLSGGLNYSNGDITINGGDRAMHITGLGSGATLPLQRPLNPAGLGSVVYMSFLYNNTVNANGADDFFQVGFDPVGGNNPNVSAVDENAEFRARLGTSSGPTTGITSDVNQTYFVLMRLEDTGGAAGYDKLDLYIDPDQLDEMSNTIDVTQNSESGLDLTASAGILLFRSARLETSDEFVFDEFRIGTTFADVLPAQVPEPASIAIWSLLALAGFAYYRTLRNK